jgi:hypothetical protein
MRHLIAGVTLIALNCVVVLGQQTNKPGSILSTPMPAGLLASDQFQNIAVLQRSANFPLSQSPINSVISQSTESKQQEGPFVFQGGALYMRVPGGQLLLPVSGGGASGCFNLDLPQRIENLKEFIPRLGPVKLSRSAPYKAGAIF